MTPVEIVCKHLDPAELLTQLAEEAAELAQAALKLRRAMEGTNWTPKTVLECMTQLEEEYADIQVVLEAMDYSAPWIDYDRTYVIQNEKMRRWAKRLEEHSHG